VIPGIIMFGQCDATKMFLISVGKEYIQIIVIPIIAIFHCLWCYILIDRWGLNVIGAATATTISYTLGLLILTLVATRQQDLKNVFVFPTIESARKSFSYLKEAIWPAFIVCFDMWVYEIFVILSA
jgi:MATE family multidrug resistance protein